jgi:hypothetical protein
MSSHDVMTPRITIRDWEDGEIIKTAILLMGRQVQSDYARAASSPGADQFALTVEMNKRIGELMQLIRDVGDGTIGARPSTDETPKD